MMTDIVSVEKVLNSRCSCDFDGEPKNNHWGMFIKDRSPPPGIVERMLGYCSIPQFSLGRLSMWLEDTHLFLGFEKTRDSFETLMLHVESGMQQEAVYLACTALGLGTCARAIQKGQEPWRTYKGREPGMFESDGAVDAF